MWAAEGARGGEGGEADTESDEEIEEYIERDDVDDDYEEEETIEVGRRGPLEGERMDMDETVDEGEGEGFEEVEDEALAVDENNLSGRDHNKPSEEA